MFEKQKIEKVPIIPFVVICIGVIGLIIRIYYTPQEIPLTLDAFRYFLFANDTAIIGNLPINYNFPNIGWSLFLSILFQIFRFEYYLDSMMIQRICSEIFSVLTIIPLYFLSKKFFDKRLALVGISFFVFSPYIIENSILGITDSLFIFLISSFLALFFSNNMRNSVYAFPILALSALIRYESVLLIIPATIIFLNKFKNENNGKVSYFFGLFLFFIVIMPFTVWKIQMGLPDGLLSHLVAGGNVVINPGEYVNGDTKFNLILGLTNLPRFLGYLSLPILFIFVPYSIISLIKNSKKDFRMFIFFGVFSLIPALYAFGRGFEEVRYVFVIIPILIVSSLFLIEKISSKINYKIFYASLIIVICSTSTLFVESRDIDIEYKMEAIQVAKFVSDLPGKINDYGPESHYVEAMNLEDYEFPILSSEIQFKNQVVNVSGETIEDILKNFKNKQVSYLAITKQSMENNQVLKEIFYEEKYSFFNKIYDSKNSLKEFNIKIFEIDYSKINL